MIINKLRKNNEMRVFDISWNSIGTNLNIEPQLEDITKGAKPERNFMNYEINEFRSTMNLTFKKELFPQKEDPKVYEAAFQAAAEVLKDDEMICIFPEGAITRDGSLGEFKGGVMKILELHPAPVVPLALHNLWGSFFSRIEGAAMTKPFRRGVWSRVSLRAGPSIAAHDVQPELLRERVKSLLGV